MGRSAEKERKLQNPREKLNSQTEEEKAKREQHKPLVPPPATGHHRLRRSGRGGELALEVSSGERTRAGCVETA